MGMLSSIAATAAPQPVLRTAALPTGPTLTVVPATYVVNQAAAVMPVQAKTAGSGVAPELPESTAARLLVQNAEGIELDNIPFTNDGAILLDDLPMPETPEAPPVPRTEPEPEQAKTPDLALVATRGYLAGREAAAPQEPEPTSNPEPAAEPLLGSGD